MGNCLDCNQDLLLFLQALSELRKGEEKARDVVVTEERARLEALEEALARKADAQARRLTHCLADLASAEAEDKALQEAMALDSQGPVAEKALQQERLEGLQGELDELLRRVESKRREIKEVEQKIGATDAALATSRGRFDKSLKRVKDRKQSIETEQAVADAEVAALQGERSRFASQQQDLARLESRFAANVQRIAEQMADCELFTSRLRPNHYANCPPQLMTAETEAKAALVEAKRVLSEHLRRRDELRGTLADVEAKLSEHSAIIAQANSVLPTLNAAKAAAVRAKNYKEAGLRVKEIKDQEDARAASELAVASLSEQLTGSARELSSVEADEPQSREKVTTCEHALDTCRIQQLLHHVVTLEARVAENLHQDGPRWHEERTTLGLQLDMQRAAIAQICARHGWALDHVKLPTPEAEKPVADPVAVAPLGDLATFLSETPLVASDVSQPAVPDFSPLELFSAPTPGGETKLAEVVQESLEALRDKHKSLLAAVANLQAELDAAIETENFEAAERMNDDMLQLTQE